ncbi:MAG: carbohydrate ABC transporter permease [Spirochaetes bacterium]|nr:MAG: carbohydrate ABC transporter permease [Spirochaetota bacterium]
MKKLNPKNIVIIFILVILGVFFLMPIYFAVINSFKPLSEIVTSYTDFPKSFYLGNYIKAWIKTDFPRVFLNSLIITVISLSGIILISSMAGYILVRTPGKLSWLLFVIIVSSMIIPFHTIMIPLIVVTRKLNLSNSIPGIILVYWGLGCNFAIFLYHGFVKTIPHELEESAVMDGCTPYQTFFKIVMPLLVPVTSTIAVLDALWIWNDFLLPLLLLQRKAIQTIPLSQYIFFGQYYSDWGLALAGLILAVLPIVIFYIFMQKYIVKGITAGAVKS